MCVASLHVDTGAPLPRARESHSRNFVGGARLRLDGSSHPGIGFDRARRSARGAQDRENDRWQQQRGNIAVADRDGLAIQKREGKAQERSPLPCPRRGPCAAPEDKNRIIGKPQSEGAALGQNPDRRTVDALPLFPELGNQKCQVAGNVEILRKVGGNRRIAGSGSKQRVHRENLKAVWILSFRNSPDARASVV